MSLLVVGVSHRTAPLDLLERVALDGGGARALAVAACATGAASEAVVLATCNRVELYAEVSAFHPGVHDLAVAIAERTGVPLDVLCEHLTFAHGASAVEHLFSVAAGLDSMAVGESQVLGQVRLALRRGQEDGTAGRVVGRLVQQALRVGKRVHSETGLDHAGRSLVEAALEGSQDVVGPMTGVRALVVGAGSMSALAATTLHRAGVAAITVANRTPERAQRLAEAVGGDWLGLDDAPALRTALATADVVVSCTGAVGAVLDAGDLADARAERARASGGAAAPQLVVDLALPHDVDPAVADLEGVQLVGLAQLRERLRTDAGSSVEGDVRSARDIVTQEVAAHLADERAASVAPAVAALRSLAGEVVDGELARLRSRLGPDGDPRALAEAERAVHRVVEKLLHTPSVRVKELAAGSDDGATWAAALRELFDLGPAPAGAARLAPSAGPVGAATAVGVGPGTGPSAATVGRVADALAVAVSDAAAEPGQEAAR